MQNMSPRQREKMFLLSPKQGVSTFSGFVIFLVICTMLMACSEEKGKKPQIGEPAPIFSIQDLEGNIFDLAKVKGSPVLLRFFLTDCKYCRADTPVFNDFYSQYKKHGLKVLYIDSLGVDPKVVETFAKELGILFPVAQDRDGEITSKYMVRALPQTIVLDPEHKIIAAILGGISEAELTRLLSPYLIEKS